MRKDGTLLPPRVFPKDSRYATITLVLQQNRERTLGSKGLVDQVKLPEGCSEEEWIAVNTQEIFNELNLLVGAFQEWCTDASCPDMTAGTFSYAWADGGDYKTPTKMSAPQYCECCLTWVDKQLADEAFMPVKPDVPFPANFRKGLKVIYKRLFRIYAHTFHSHFKEIMEGEADAHLNHSFKHFLYFIKEFDLIEEPELDPLKDLVALCMQQKDQP